MLKVAGELVNAIDEIEEEPLLIFSLLLIDILFGFVVIFLFG